jgi:Transposase DDE domain
MPNRRISATKIEEVFGWIKTTGGLRKTRHRGTAPVGWMFTLTTAAYNLVRMPKLLAAAAASWPWSVPRHASRPAAHRNPRNPHATRLSNASRPRKYAKFARFSAAC